MLPRYKKVIVSFADLLGWLNWANDSIVEKALGHGRFSYRASEKRAFDVLLSVVATLFLFPVFLAIAVALKLSGDPLFEKSRRVGLNGKAFTLLHFRTKKSNGETFTTVGHFLHCLDLDALPNIFSVMRGDMSFVGPRPLPEETWARSFPYARAEISDWLIKRSQVRPGLTGISQLGFPMRNLSFQQILSLDLYYFANSSIWLDVYILLKTVRMGFISPQSLRSQLRFWKVEMDSLLGKEMIVRSATVLVKHQPIVFTYEPNVGWQVESDIADHYSVAG